MRQRASEPSAPSERASGSVDAARAYKELVAGLTAPADRLREHDRARLAALESRLVELAAAVAQAQQRAEASRSQARARWEEALESLWTESWLKLRPLPRPDRWADPAELDALDADVVRRAEELHVALRRRRWR